MKVLSQDVESAFSRVLAGFDPQSHTVCHNLMRHVASLLPRLDEMPDQVRQDTGGERVPHFNIPFLYAFNRLD